MKALALEIARPGCTTRFEQIKCADDVGLNEIARTGDGRIHMRLGGQMKHVSNWMPIEDAEQRRLVPQIDLFENVFWGLIDSFEVLKMPGVGEAIEVHELLDFGPVNDVANHIRSNKPSAA